MCIRCDLGAPENTVHMIMQCPANDESRMLTYREITNICPGIDPQEFLSIIMGKYIDGWDFGDMIPIWETSARHITKMYFDTLRDREGMG